MFFCITNGPVAKIAEHRNGVHHVRWSPLGKEERRWNRVKEILVPIPFAFKARGFRNAIYFRGRRPHVATVTRQDQSTDTGRPGDRARDGAERAKLLGRQAEASFTTEANITDQTSLISRLIKSSLCVYDKRATISSSSPIALACCQWLRRRARPRRQCNIGDGTHWYYALSSCWERFGT